MRTTTSRGSIEARESSKSDSELESSKEVSEEVQSEGEGEGALKEDIEECGSSDEVAEKMIGKKRRGEREDLVLRRATVICARRNAVWSEIQSERVA